MGLSWFPRKRPSSLTAMLAPWRPPATAPRSGSSEPPSRRASRCRVAANGDVANKIGTYPLAVLARENGVPFYVAAPVSTIDLSTPEGDAIPIEQRDPSEVTHIGGSRVAPEGVGASNPAFDITPHRYVTAIVTERGIVRPPYVETLRGLVAGQ